MSRDNQKDEPMETNYVKVVVRCRPLSDKEAANGHQNIVEFDPTKGTLTITNPKRAHSDHLSGRSSARRGHESHVFKFDQIFDWNSSQGLVYDSTCEPIVSSVLKGYNGTILVYGQTGTGKTYTIQGIMPRVFKQIFDHVSAHKSDQFLIRASYLEIYLEEIHDLLRKDPSVKLELHERPDLGIFVKDCTSYVCKSVAELQKVLSVGNRNRRVGVTDMNEHSSRSHAIFTITIEHQQESAISVQSEASKAGEHLTANARTRHHRSRVVRVGKLNLVDLAGNESQAKTNNVGQRQRESIKINLSLSALGNVINVLMKLNEKQSNAKNISEPARSVRLPSASDGQPLFVPYRDSKLTRLLQDSLGGNAKTLMIANIGPASYNFEETINTLNYASRAKLIKNRPRLNEDPKDALLNELQREIDTLRARLASLGSGVGNELVAPTSITATTSDSNYQPDREAVERELADLRTKLASLEGKLLNSETSSHFLSGSIDDPTSRLDQHVLQDYTRDQEATLERRRAELANQTDRENTIQYELERHEEAEFMATETHSSIEQETGAKKNLIRQVLLKIKTMRDEIEASQSARALELSELEQLQCVLQKELKLKCLIMDNFILSNHVDETLDRIVFDERTNSCTTIPRWLAIDECQFNQHQTWFQIEPDPLSYQTEFSRIGSTIYPNDIRFMRKNLISMHLDSPQRFVNRRPRKLGRLQVELLDHSSAAAGGWLQAMILDVLSEAEPDITIN